jgi:hypothetical protein
MKRILTPLSLVATVLALCVLGLVGLDASAGGDSFRQNRKKEGRDDQDGKQEGAEGLRGRGDIRHLPKPLRERLVELDGRPHTYPPLTVFAEAPSPSQLFAYFLLDTEAFEPNVFTSIIPGINDGTAPTAANCANRGMDTLGAIRLVVEPKPGLPTDPNDPGAFIDVFTDVSGLFVINNESGWYEGWMIHDIAVPPVAPAFPDGHPQFGTMTQADADALKAMGKGNNVPPHLFTTDGNPPMSPSAGDHFPDRQSNLVPVFLSMGAWNALQQADAHAYWEFNQYTDWVFPTYESPATGGDPADFGAGAVGGCVSLVPGSGPSGVKNDPATYGDAPENPRDPDRLLNTSPNDLDCPMVNNDDRKEKRLRFIPSGLAREILLDVYVRVASFEHAMTDKKQRLYDAYAFEVGRIDQNGDGVLDAVEADLEEESDGLSNDRLFIPAPQFNRFAVTREINDGLLAPRFAPSQRAWVLSGRIQLVDPAVPASIPQDFDNR